MKFPWLRLCLWIHINFVLTQINFLSILRKGAGTYFGKLILWRDNIVQNRNFTRQFCYFGWENTCSTKGWGVSIFIHHLNFKLPHKWILCLHHLHNNLTAAGVKQVISPKKSQDFVGTTKCLKIEDLLWRKKSANQFVLLNDDGRTFDKWQFHEKMSL